MDIPALLCHICLYNQAFAKNDEERGLEIKPATTFYNGNALCSEHWATTVELERAYVYAQHDGHRPEPINELHLGPRAV